jgi:hypothetical protein
MQLGSRKPVIRNVVFPTQAIVDTFPTTQNPLVKTSSGLTWSTTAVNSTSTVLVLQSAGGACFRASAGTCSQYILTDFGPNLEVGSAVGTQWISDAVMTYYLRLTNPGSATFNAYRVQFTNPSVGNNSYALSRFVSGTGTGLVNTSTATTLVSPFGVRIVGNRITLYHNTNVVLVDFVDDAAPPVMGAGKVGIGMNFGLSGNGADNLRIGTLGGNI